MEEGARKAIDELFRKDWRLRRLLDFTRPYRVQPRALQRMLPRARREKIAELMQACTNIQDYNEQLFGPRALQLAMADAIAPHWGHRAKFTKDFVSRVDALVSASNSKTNLKAIHAHRIAGDRRSPSWGDRTKAIKTILLLTRGRMLTKLEIAEALVVYRQRLLGTRLG